MYVTYYCISHTKSTEEGTLLRFFPKRSGIVIVVTSQGPATPKNSPSSWNSEQAFRVRVPACTSTRNISPKPCSHSPTDLSPQIKEQNAPEH